MENRQYIIETELLQLQISLLTELMNIRLLLHLMRQ